MQQQAFVLGHPSNAAVLQPGDGGIDRVVILPLQRVVVEDCRALPARPQEQTEQDMGPRTVAVRRRDPALGLGRHDATS